MNLKHPHSPAKNSFKNMRTPAVAPTTAKEDKPYAEWTKYQKGLIDDVREALLAHPNIDLSWQKGKKDRVRPLTEIDLAVGFWAVIFNDHSKAEQPKMANSVCRYSRFDNLTGFLSYGQLAAAFKVCQGVGCHRNKAARILRILQEIDLIEKVANYSSGFHGNGYCRYIEPATQAGINGFFQQLRTPNLPQDPAA